MLFKAGTHEGACSRSTLLQHALGVKLPRLHQRFLAKKYVVQQNFVCNIFFARNLWCRRGIFAPGACCRSACCGSKLPRRALRVYIGQQRAPSASAGPWTFAWCLPSFSTLHRHVIVGRPPLRFPSGVQCKTVFVMKASWQVTWPIHLQNLLIRYGIHWFMQSPHRSKRSLFENTLGQEMRRIRRRLLVQNVESFDKSFPVTLSANTLNHTGELWGRSCVRV